MRSRVRTIGAAPERCSLYAGSARFQRAPFGIMPNESLEGLPQDPANSAPEARAPRAGFTAARISSILFILVSSSCVSLFAQSPAPATSQAPLPEPPRSSLLSSSQASNVAINPLPASVSAPAGYVLSANDQIAVEVFGEDDLRTNGRLNAEGNFSVPLIGSVHLGGMTITQAAAKLTELYGRDYLVNPRVNVMLVGYAHRRFTMLGQVNRPGSYELPEGAQDGIDILEAVAMAGGYTRIAAPERISVRRRKAAGGDEVVRVDAKRLARSSGQGFTIRAGDTVTIGESLF